MPATKNPNRYPPYLHEILHELKNGTFTPITAEFETEREAKRTRQQVLDFRKALQYQAEKRPDLADNYTIFLSIATRITPNPNDTWYTLTITTSLMHDPFANRTHRTHRTPNKVAPKNTLQEPETQPDPEQALLQEYTYKRNEVAKLLREFLMTAFLTNYVTRPGLDTRPLDLYRTVREEHPEKLPQDSLINAVELLETFLTEHPSFSTNED